MKRVILLGVLILLRPTAVLAYEEMTHKVLSEQAFLGSIITADPAVIEQLGLRPLSASETFPDSTNYGQSIQSIKDLIRSGAGYEDSGPPHLLGFIPQRSIQHFYDPVSDSGLIAPALGIGPAGVGNNKSNKAYVWALEQDSQDSGSGQKENQDNSYADAKSYLYKAITDKSETERRRYFGLFFQSLGQIIHLIQDMAQSEHTRNDVHIHDSRIDPIVQGVAQGYFETHTKETVTPQYVSILPFYPAVGFRDGQSFWVSPFGSGLAQYSNRNFVTRDSNFTYRQGQAVTGAYPSPVALPGSQKISLHDLMGGAGDALCDRVRNDPVLATRPPAPCTIEFYRTTVFDAYTGGSQTNGRASSLSLFDQFLQGYGSVTYRYIQGEPIVTVDRVFTLNKFNVEGALPLLMPQAIAYSTGFLNHVFRGRIDISAPADGVYAVLDHAVANGYHRGFKTIRLGLTNSSPESRVSISATKSVDIANGTLIAVARYNLNHCYRPDLSGEVVQTASGGFVEPCDMENQYWAGPQEVSVSKEEPLIGALSTTAPQQFEFDFSEDEIPINARELHIQVVFRGFVSSERNGIVVATKDISEPTYISILNNTDRFVILGHYRTAQELRDSIAHDPNSPYRSILDTNNDGVVDSSRHIDPVNFTDVKLRINSTDLIAPMDLPAGRYIRLAVLVDAGTPFHERLDWVQPVPGESAQTFEVERDPLLNQTDRISGHKTLASFHVARDFRYYHLLYVNRGTDTGNPPIEEFWTLPPGINTPLPVAPASL